MRYSHELKGCSSAQKKVLQRVPASLFKNMQQYPVQVTAAGTIQTDHKPFCYQCSLGNSLKTATQFLCHKRYSCDLCRQTRLVHCLPVQLTLSLAAVHHDIDGEDDCQKPGVELAGLLVRDGLGGNFFSFTLELVRDGLC